MRLWRLDTGEQAYGVEAAVLAWLRLELGLAPYLSAEEMPQAGWTETVGADSVDLLDLLDRVDAEVRAARLARPLGHGHDATVAGVEGAQERSAFAGVDGEAPAPLDRDGRLCEPTVSGRPGRQPFSEVAVTLRPIARRARRNQ